MDSEATGWYVVGMRILAWLLLMLLALPVMAADDDDDEERDSGAHSRRLQSIDEAAAREADHPASAADADAEEPDDPATEPGDADDEAPVRARPRSRTTPSTVPPKSPGGTGAAPGDADEHY
jgi:hypothetical protein